MISESLSELRDNLVPELKILMLAVSDAWGGLEQTVLSDAELLVEHGFELVMFVKRDSPLDHYVAQSKTNFKVEYFSHKVGEIIDFRFMKCVHQAINKHGINLVHCHQGSVIGSLVGALLRQRKVALVLSRHILNNHNKKDPIHALIYRRVDYVLVLSSTMKNNLRATFPLPDKKLRIVNLGLNLRQFDPSRVDRAQARLELGIEPDEFLVGVIGRLDPLKGQDLLVKALAQIRGKIPKLKALVVGAETPGLEGSYVRELQKTVSDLRLEKTVKILGPQDNIPEIMSALDLFVMPSQAEAFGLVALEAMAMGVPALLSHAGSAAELAGGDRAALFRPGDAFDLSRKIRNLYRNVKFREQMVEKAQGYVRDRYTSEYRLERTLEIYGRCKRRRGLSVGRSSGPNSHSNSL